MAENARPVLVGEYLEGIQKNLRDAVVDLQHLKNLCKGANMATDPVCHLFTCPRLQTLKKLIQETVDVLEMTKSSFRSKELGTLRRKMEQVLEELD